MLNNIRPVLHTFLPSFKLEESSEWIDCLTVLAQKETIEAVREAAVNKMEPTGELEPCAVIYAVANTLMLDNRISYRASKFMNGTR